MTLTKHLTITLPNAPTTSSPSSSTTQFPPTHRTFPIPRSPYPWVWRCHKCHTVFRFSAALNRCLQCSHRFCAKCVSEFDYSGWEHWKSYWHPGCGPEKGEEGEDEDLEVWEDVYRGERGREQEEILWDGFEIVTQGGGRELNLDMDIDEDVESATPPTSPSSDGSDEVKCVPAMTQNYLQYTQSPTHATDTSPPQEPRHTFSLATYGEECEPMRDFSSPPVPTSTSESGYRSVQEARKALYPGDENNGAYGTGEEGETMRNWPGCFNTDEARKRLYFCKGIDETVECGVGKREKGEGEGEDEPLWSPGLMSPLAFGRSFF